MAKKKASSKSSNGVAANGGSAAPTAATTTWDGNGMTQEDMMIKDTVLVLDKDDNVIGSASKRTSHEFTIQQERGILHRAFSVFLFDESTGELLLQQRASTKITFPNVRKFNSARFGLSLAGTKRFVLTTHCFVSLAFSGNFVL